MIRKRTRKYLKKAKANRKVRVRGTKVTAEWLNALQDFSKSLCESDETSGDGPQPED